MSPNVSNDPNRYIGVKIYSLLIPIFHLQHYLPSTRNNEGVYSLENGIEYYKSLLHWHLSVNKDPQELHNLGLQEVARIKNKLFTVSNSKKSYEKVMTSL